MPVNQAAQRGYRYQCPLRVNQPVIDWGVSGQPATGLSPNRSLVHPVPRGVLLAVVHGLGPEAAEAAELAVRTLREHANETVTALVRRCHEATAGSHRLTIGTAMINRIRGTLTWLGVGNVAGAVLSRGNTGRYQRQETLFQRAGVVGAQLPPLAPSIVPLMPRDLVIIRTNGMHMGVRRPSLLADSPQEIADQIVAEHHKDAADALVFVSRYLGQSARA